MNIFGSKKPEEDIKASETLEDIVGDFREELEVDEEEIITPEVEGGLDGVKDRADEKDRKLRRDLGSEGDD